MPVRSASPALPAVAVVILLAAHVALGGQDLSLGRLLDLVRQTEPSTVAFTERRSMQYLTEPIVLEGTLSFDPPDRLTREVHRPNRETMVIEGDLLTLKANWKDPPTRVLLADYPGLDALITALRAVLSGDAEALERVYQIDLRGTAEAWTLALIPRAESLRAVVASVVLEGAAETVRSIEVQETGGDSSVITVHGPK